MTFLRRTLRWQATLWLAFGVVLLLAPGWLLETVLDQPRPVPIGWARVAGVMAIALAGQMVLVGRRVEELWWWSWTFVFLELGVALVLIVTVSLGLPDGAAAWPWWTLGIANAGLAALEIGALAKAGTERSPV